MAPQCGVDARFRAGRAWVVDAPGENRARAGRPNLVGFHLKADPYRRPQRGPVTDVDLPRGLRGRRVS